MQGGGSDRKTVCRDVEQLTEHTILLQLTERTEFLWKEDIFLQKKPPHPRGFSFIHYALSTLPDLKQEAHTYNFFGVPLTLQLTRLMFDFHILFDLL